MKLNQRCNGWFANVRASRPRKLNRFLGWEVERTHLGRSDDTATSLVAMDPPAKKMRTSPPTLCDMPNEILALIASNLEPGDVFNMVLSSKKIFCPAGVVDMTANQEEALGIKLVKWSMRRRLNEVLKDARSGFTIDDLFPEEERNLDFVSGQPQVSFSLHSHQPPAQICIVILTRSIASQMIIAGSAAVKCAVPSRSRKWRPGDIDIFCTWDAAPMVRRRLFQRCGLICGGVVNVYDACAEEVLFNTQYLAGDVENRASAVIHHVEAYANRPTQEAKYNREVGSDAEDSMRLQRLRQSADTWWVGNLTPEAYYNQAKQWGAEVLAPSHRYSTPDPNIGMPGGALGGDFLFDYHFERVGFVQLIIGKPHVKDATKLLRHFDIEICKCAFSASKVYIPAAVETLAGRTFINPARHALADSFMKALNQVKPKFPDGTCNYASDMPKVLAKMSKQVWKGIGLPSYNGDEYDFEHKYTVIVRLFQRIQKYHRRGLKITNAPDGALDWDIPELAPDFNYMC